MQSMSSRQHAAAQVQPVIAELLRTCVRPPKLYLSIEHVLRSTEKRESDSESDNPSGRTTKLFLTDGQLVIQALLHRKLRNLPGIEDLRKGDVVEIHDFAIKKARRRNGKGHVVYLGIENCYVIQTEDQVEDKEYNVTPSAQTGSTGTKRSINLVEQGDSLSMFDDTAGGFFRDNEAAAFTPTVPATGDKIEDNRSFLDESVLRSPTERAISRMRAERVERKDFAADVSQRPQGVSTSTHLLAKRKSIGSQTDSDEEAFETLSIDLGTVNKRRKVLHELSQNLASSPIRPPTRDSVAKVKFIAKELETPARASTVRFDLDELVKHSESDPKSGVSPRPQKDSEQLDDDHSQDRNAFVSNTYGNKSKSSSALLDLLALPNPASSRPTTPTQGDSTHDWGKFHTLISLYSPSLPSKSYAFTTLVIPTYVASHLIYRPNSAFPPKRHVKVIDPTLASKFNIGSSNVMGKGITVSVYRNAQHFKPIIGRVALMRGVVMQRLNSAIKNGSGNKSGGGSNNCEVILNVYPAKSRIQRQSQSQSQQGLSRVVQSNASRFSETPHTDQQRPSNPTTHSNPNTTRDGNSLKQNKTDADFLSHHQTQQTEATLIESWFIDDHDVLRKQGYQIDALQSWWDRITGLQ